MAGKNVVGIREVAAASGVSIATVSRAFKNDTEISDATRKNILEVAASMGYFPNPSARGLRIRKTNNVGLILPSNDNKLYLKFIKYLEMSLQKYKMKLIIHFMNENDAVHENEALLSMLHADVDATMFIPNKNKFSTELLGKYGEALNPVQVFHSVYPRFDSFRIDDSIGIKNAVDYICSMGHRRILFLGTESRLGAYKKALEEHRVPYVPELVNTDCANISADEVFDAVKKNNPTVVFAVGNAAEKAFWSLLYHHIFIPEDMSLVAYDDVDWVSTFNVTAVKHPLEQMSSDIAELVHKRTENQCRGNVLHNSYSPLLVIRNSVRQIK